MLSGFCSPSRSTQGKNATAALGQEMVALGLRGPALVVAGRSAIRLLEATWQRTFKEAGIVPAVHPFGGECSLAEIERTKAAAQRHRAGVIVGAGGGKPVAGVSITNSPLWKTQVILSQPALPSICTLLPLDSLRRIGPLRHELRVVAQVDADRSPQLTAFENCPPNAFQRSAVCDVSSVPAELSRTLSISLLCAVVVDEAPDISELE